MNSKPLKGYQKVVMALTPVNLVVGYLAGYYSEIKLEDTLHLRNVTGLALLAAGEGVGIAALVNREEQRDGGLDGFISANFAGAELLAGYMVGIVMRTNIG
ncbi:MAG: hypothetical protein Q8Q01_05585 [archaeon]|nr:hypothetical protein [archaeon]